MWIDFLKAIVVGFVGSIPLGPIGVLCIQRTLNRGRLSGFISGAGAATADTIFAAFAILGLAIIQRLMEQHEAYFLLLGGIIIGILGVKIYFTNPIVQLRKSRQRKGRFVEDFVSTLMLTLTNPGPIFLLLGLFALVNIKLSSEPYTVNVGLALWGVFIGAMGWWFTLTLLIDRFRKKFRLKQLWITNRISGIAIFVMGIISLFSGVWELVLPLLRK